MISLPQNQAAINWTFDRPFSKIRFVLDIPSLPSDKNGNPSLRGVYIILYDQTINNTGAYLGLQTNLMKPEKGLGHVATNSFGLIFSRWESRTNEDLRVALNGYIENGLHEGGFIGVRMPMEFVSGQYVIELNGETPNGENVWYNCSVIHPNKGKVDCGGLRFPLVDGKNIGFADHGGTSMELYQTIEATGFMDIDDVPAWRFNIGQPVVNETFTPKRARLTYPYKQMKLSNVEMDLASGDIKVQLGNNVEQKNQDGLLFEN